MEKVLNTSVGGKMVKLMVLVRKIVCMVILLQDNGTNQITMNVLIGVYSNLNIMKILLWYLLTLQMMISHILKIQKMVSVQTTGNGQMN